MGNITMVIAVPAVGKAVARSLTSVQSIYTLLSKVTRAGMSYKTKKKQQAKPGIQSQYAASADTIDDTTVPCTSQPQIISPSVAPLSTLAPGTKKKKYYCFQPKNGNQNE